MKTLKRNAASGPTYHLEPLEGKTFFDGTAFTFSNQTTFAITNTTGDTALSATLSGTGTVTSTQGFQQFSLSATVQGTETISSTGSSHDAGVSASFLIDDSSGYGGGFSLSAQYTIQSDGSPLYEVSGSIALDKANGVANPTIEFTATQNGFYGTFNYNFDEHVTGSVTVGRTDGTFCFYIGVSYNP